MQLPAGRKRPSFRPKADEEGKDIQYQGYVWAFLLASGIIIWAVTGELATMGPLLAELHGEKAISAEALAILWGVLVVGLLVVLFYSWNTIYWQIERKSSVPAAKKRRVEKLKSQGRAVGTLQQNEPELPGFQML